MTGKSQKRRIVLAMIAVFLLGTAVGTGATTLFIRNRIFGALDKGPAGIRGLMMDRVTSLLHLTPQQQTDLAPVLTRMHEKIIAFRQKHFTTILGILNEGIEEALPALDKEQQYTLKAFAEKWRKKFEVFDKEQPLSTATPAQEAVAK